MHPVGAREELGVEAVGGSSAGVLFEASTAWFGLVIRSLGSSIDIPLIRDIRLVDLPRFCF